MAASTLRWLHTPLTRTNIVTPIPGNPTFVDQIGEARSRGVEVDLAGHLTERLQVMANYAYTDARITKDTTPTGDPGNAGHRLYNIPLHQGGIWLQYSLPSGWRFGAGAFSASDRWGNNENTFKIGDYIRVDTNVSYSWDTGFGKPDQRARSPIAMKGFAMRRRFWVLVHRCAGLYLAFFLVIAGATGSLLAFFNELNGWLQLDLMHIEVDGRDMIDPFELRERALLHAPGVFVDSVDLTRTPEYSYVAWVRHRAELEPDDTPFSVIILDPYSGRELTRRVQGNSWPPTTEAIMEFVYALHYRLPLNQIGIWLFGIAALIWTADCFVGFFLTLPARSSRNRPPARRRSWSSRWGAAWRVRWRASRFRFHFDLHRAFGLWVWPLLLVFALSAVSFNLSREVYEPFMKTVFGFEDVEDGIAPLPAPRDQPIMAWRDAHAAARMLMEQAALQHGFRIIRENMLNYHPDRGMSSYHVLSDKDVNQRFGATTLYMRDGNAERLGLSLPSGQNAARTFTTWIRTIHTAAVGGLLMQVLVSALGLFVVVISLTGVVIFARKRAA